jgi:hypothetical protein
VTEGSLWCRYVTARARSSAQARALSVLGRQAQAGLLRLRLLRLLAEVEGPDAAVGHALRHDDPRLAADAGGEPGAQEADDIWVPVPQLSHSSDLGLKAVRLIMANDSVIFHQYLANDSVICHRGREETSFDHDFPGRKARRRGPGP